MSGSPGSLSIACVALDVPGTDAFDYRIPPEQVGTLVPGAWVLVPWGRTRRVGIVVRLREHSDVPAERLRCVIGRFAEAPEPDPGWIEMIRFVARYYHRHLGEVALPAIPKLLRTPPAARARGTVFARARKRWDALRPAAGAAGGNARGDRVEAANRRAGVGQGAGHDTAAHAATSDVAA
ncbi:MAG: hypothetical protein KJZ83_23680, partial [Burkholderiaceae bacterium]|nr:hypothetical protein [Burkholderiaceae bacterium]